MKITKKKNYSYYSFRLDKDVRGFSLDIVFLFSASDNFNYVSISCQCPDFQKGQNVL